MSSKAIIRIKTVRNTTSESFIGFRIEAAVPNMQGRKVRANFNSEGGVDSFHATDEPAPSFRKPYLIKESSDFSSLDKQMIEKFQKSLDWYGYDQFEYIGKPLNAIMG